MKLTVSKAELIKKLSDIQNIVEKKNTMPILGHFLLDAAKGGSVITATDLETAIREPINLEVADEGRLAIPARKLFEIARELDDDLTLEAQDNQWLKIKAGKSKFRLACLAPEEFPVWPEMSGSEEISLDAPSLLEMIEKTIYASGETDSRYTLNGLLFHFQTEPAALTVVGTDGHRMAVIDKQLENTLTEEKKVIIPRKAASELRKFLPEEGGIDMLIGKNHVLFKTGGISFLARLIDGSYPNYSQVLPSVNEKKIEIDRETFVKAFKRVSIISRERNNSIKLELKENQIILSSSNPDLGEASDELQIEYKDEELTLGFNSKYILDALGSMSSEKISFELHDQLSPSLIRQKDDEQYRCVVMPMRV